MHNKKLYVAYGSNLNLRQMAMRCPTAKLVGTGVINGYTLQFKGMPNGAFATIAPKENAFVPVALWEITPRDERALDMYEGYPSHYFKQNIAVALPDKTVNAMVYLMNLNMQFGIPSQRYYDTIFEGYTQCGLDTDYLNKAVDDSIAKYQEQVEQELHENELDEESEADYGEGFGQQYKW